MKEICWNDGIKVRKNRLESKQLIGAEEGDGNKNTAGQRHSRRRRAATALRTSLPAASSCVKAEGQAAIAAGGTVLSRSSIYMLSDRLQSSS